MRHVNCIFVPFGWTRYQPFPVLFIISAYFPLYSLFLSCTLLEYGSITHDPGLYETLHSLSVRLFVRDHDIAPVLGLALLR